jgi:hypothetical protein
MMYGTAHDTLNGHGPGLGIIDAPQPPRRRLLSGLSSVSFGPYAAILPSSVARGGVITPAALQTPFGNIPLSQLAGGVTSDWTIWAGTSQGALNIAPASPITVVLRSPDGSIWSYVITAPPAVRGISPPPGVVATKLKGPDPAIPAGWSPVPSVPNSWTPHQNSWPITDGVPQYDPATGMTAITGTQYWGLDTNIFPDLDPAHWFDFAIKETDLGQITGTNGRLYEMMELQVQDLRTGTIKTFYYAWEGGGGGNWISQNVLTHAITSDILEAVTAVVSGGIVPVVAATGVVPQSVITTTNDVIGGAVVGGVAAVVSAGALAPVIAGAAETTIAGATAATAVAGGIQGGVQGALDQNSSAILAGAAEGGAAAGATTDIAQAIMAPSGTVPQTPAQPTPYTPGQSSILPAGADSTTPTTLVSPDAGTETLAANTPVDETVPVDTGVTEGPLVPAGGLPAAAPSAISSAAASATHVAETTIGSVVVATGTTALTTELKKLTGQLPKPSGGYQPGQPTPTITPTAPASGISGKVLAMGAAAILLLSKKS